MSKYKNKKVVVNGIEFHSKWESERYLVLHHYELEGKIRNFELQHPFVIEVAGTKICTYHADFKYFIPKPTPTLVVEDTKGMSTDVFALKAKLFLAIYGQDYMFLEVKRSHVNQLSVDGRGLKRKRIEWTH